MKFYSFFILLCFFSSPLKAQEVYNQSFSVSGLEHFLLSNIEGDISVRQSKDDQIRVRAIWNGKSPEYKDHIKLKQAEDYLAVYIHLPHRCGIENNTFDPAHPLRIVSQGMDCRWENEDAPPVLDFELWVPIGVNVYVSTINHGDLDVVDIRNTLWTHNVNGSIRISKVDKLLSATTVNGQVEIEMNQVPDRQARFSTINGDIRLQLPEEMNADINFKTFNGEFFTDHKEVKVLPMQKLLEDEKGHFKYKVDDRQKIRLGAGGPALDFETFNGNVYILAGNS